MIYNRTEHSQGVCICFIIKRPLNSPRITFNFSKKFYFQANNGTVSMLYTLIEHALFIYLYLFIYLIIYLIYLLFIFQPLFQRALYPNFII